MPLKQAGVALAAAALAVASLTVSADAAPGVLDTTFGDNGFWTTTVASGTFGADDVAVEPDGRILLAGSGTLEEGTGALVVRVTALNADGRPDPSFGGDGLVVVQGAGHYPSPSFVRVQQVPGDPEGWRILVVGPDVPPTRLHRDGTIDTSFKPTPAEHRALYVHSLADFAVYPDGRMLLLYPEPPSVYRLLPDGTADPSFGDRGVAFPDIGTGGRGPGSVRATAIAIQHDGRIVLSGLSHASCGRPLGSLLGVQPHSSPERGCRASLEDTGFYVGVDLPPGIVRGQGPETRTFVARLDPDGRLDSKFGDRTPGLLGQLSGDARSGVAFLENPASDASGLGYALHESLVLQGERPVLAGWTSFRRGGNDLALARFRADGSLDTSFGSGGLVVAGRGTHSHARQVVVGRDDTLLVAGSSVPTGCCRYQFLIARFLPDGAPDRTFGDGGHLLVAPGSVSDQATSIVLSERGPVVAGARGEGSDGSSGGRAAARLVD